MPTEEFLYAEGQVQQWKVPAQVELINVTIEGGNSGNRRGGKIVGRLKVKPGDTYFIGVGRRGNTTTNFKGGDPVFDGGGQGGDGAGNGRHGGNGGGGASWIRINARDGRIVTVAGGAGGNSGDGGLGGEGGNSASEQDRGQAGSPAPASNNSGSAATGNATGGTQNQGGKGGSTSTGQAYAGGDGGGKLERGGRGGQYASGGPGMFGGGGGGGGYYPGGGGAAGRAGITKGGGGAGGSNFVGDLFNATSTRGGSSVDPDNGRVVLQWDTPGGDKPPTAPNDLKINGMPISPGLATRAGRSVTLTGSPNDPDQKENVRLLVRYSAHQNFSAVQEREGTYDSQNDRDKVELDGLVGSTLYYVRVHTQQQNPKKRSDNYTSTTFWTNRSPNAPALTGPFENTEVPDTLNITFTWNHSDPDGNADGQSAYDFQYRRAAIPGAPAGELREIHQNTTAETRTFDSYAGGGPFAPGNTYEWRVRTYDENNRQGAWSVFQSFTVLGTALNPRPFDPRNGEAMRADGAITYTWNYATTRDAERQIRADVRTRIVGSRDGTYTPLDPEDDANWTTYLNAAGPERTFTISPNTYLPAYLVEWQVRAAAEDTPAVGNWSPSEFHWTVEQPGLLAPTDFLDSGLDHTGLGEGTTRVFVYDRGGQYLRGEITGARLIRWTRNRDDISNCTIFVNDFDQQTRDLLRSTRTWRHEIVAFRTNGQGRTERVWEGPITRISSSRSSLEIEAKDVMGYLYRRIMRQGYTDRYQEINGTQVGIRTVVQRSTQIILNALAYDDPNLIGYLTPLNFDNDAKSAGTKPDYSRMAWEEIDDMAAVGGLDYTAVGRRIILNDTHRPVGRLPEMTDDDFTDPPVITEYGMSAAYFFAVSDGTGVFGTAYPKNFAVARPGPEGWIEQLATSYGEGAKAGQSPTLTAKQLQERRDVFAAQARLNIAGRWSPPIVVRVPDNSRLAPTLQVSINQLIPGVWIPLRADNGFHSLSQWQKLDSLTCEQDATGEKVTVVMSPAPNGGQDPDADAVVTEG